MIGKFIVKEGKNKVLISLASIFIFLIIDFEFLAFIALIVTVIFYYIYRNRKISKSPVLKIVSPIEGEVYSIDKTEEFSTLYIKVGLFDNHQVLAPKKSKYKKISTRHGLNLDADNYKANILNTKNEIAFDDIILEFISGRYDIKHEFTDSKEVSQYDKVGFFVNGLVKLRIPNRYKVSTKIGEKIKLGQVIA